MVLDLQAIAGQALSSAEGDAEALGAADPGAPPREPALDAILAEAVRRRASHVHFEPVGRTADVRLRVRSGLTALGRLSAEQMRAIANAVDARTGAETGFREGPLTVDVSRLATRDGNRIVLRLRSEDEAGGPLATLGMRLPLVMALRAALGRGGMILLAGTRGAGTSTTLRALLAHLAETERAVLAIGPAPAARIGGVAQVALGNGLSAADALRQIEAQDVDAIGIDGLADRDTATLAVEAAQGGALVIATIAAADAVGAIRQMRDWRVGSFALASTLNLVIAQRRVHRLCPECRVPVQASRSVSALLGFDRGAIVYSAGGCASCDGTGMAGETGVFEAIEVDSGLRRLLNDGGDEAILARHAFVRAPNLGSAARALAREGVTTPEEAVRVSRG